MHSNPVGSKKCLSTMSTSNWRSWCRLCARVDGGSELNESGHPHVSDLLQKYFNISISNKDDCKVDCQVVCQNCIDLILNVEKLALNYVKVSKMFLELTKKNVFGCEVENIRHKYGFFKNMPQTNSEIDEPKLYYIDYLKIEPAEDYSHYETEELDSIIVKSDSVDKDDGNLCRYDETIEIKKYLEDDQEDCIENVSHSNEVYETAGSSKEDDIVSCDKELQPDHEEFNYQNVQVSVKSRKKRSRNLEIAKINNRTFVCTICSKSFISKNNLTKHESIHLPDNLKKMISCPYCKKMFRMRKSLTVHVKAIHTCERPYVCEECGKAFPQKGHLIQHYVTHTTDRPCSCPKCFKSFKNTAHLKKHMDIHNEDIHECSVCAKQLTTKRNLRAHMVVHSDEKRYNCHLCERKFKRLHTLKKHLVWHTGNRPFTCSFCEKTFTHGFRQSYHEKHYHPKEFALKESKVIA